MYFWIAREINSDDSFFFVAECKLNCIDGIFAGFEKRILCFILKLDENVNIKRKRKWERNKKREIKWVIEHLQRIGTINTQNEFHNNVKLICCDSFLQCFQHRNEVTENKFVIERASFTAISNEVQKMIFFVLWIWTYSSFDIFVCGFSLGVVRISKYRTFSCAKSSITSDVSFRSVTTLSVTWWIIENMWKQLTTPMSHFCFEMNILTE